MIPNIDFEKIKQKLIFAEANIDNHMIYEIVKSNLKDLKKFIDDVGQKL